MTEFFDFEKPKDREARKKKEAQEKRDRLVALKQIIDFLYLGNTALPEGIYVKTIDDDYVKKMCEDLGFTAPPPPSGRDASEWEEIVEKINKEIGSLE